MNLSDLKALISRNGVQLSWTAYTEININKYQVERSTDGTGFETIGQVPAINSGSYRYQYATTAAGSNYYHLKIVDRDGSYQYSKTVQITSGKNAEA